MHALQGKDSKQQVPPFNPLELKLDESASKTNSVDSRDEKTELVLRDSVASKEDMSKKVNFSIANRSNDAIDAKPSNKMMAKIQKVRDRRGNRHQSSTGVLEKVTHEPDQMGTTHVSKISARRQTYDQTADVKVFGGAGNMPPAIGDIVPEAVPLTQVPSKQTTMTTGLGLKASNHDRKFQSMTYEPSKSNNRASDPSDAKRMRSGLPSLADKTPSNILVQNNHCDNDDIEMLRASPRLGQRERSILAGEEDIAASP